MLKRQLVLHEIILNKLRHSKVKQIPILIFHVAQHNPFAVLHHLFHQHALHLRRLLQGCNRLNGGPWRCFHTLLNSTRRFRRPPFAALTYISVHAIDERCFGHTQSLGAIVQVSVAQNLVGNNRNALHNRRDSLRTASRIGYAIKQNPRFKLYEVGLIVGNILSKLLGIVLSGKAVGVVAIGEKQHFYVHTLGQQHVRSTQGSMYARRIAIVKQHDVRGKAV